MVQTFEVMKITILWDVTSCSLITAITLKGKLPPPVLPCRWKQKMETMKLVNESKQSYAKHLETKDAELTAFRNYTQRLTQMVEKAHAQKNKLETKRKAELKTLEDTVNQLEEKLRKKRAKNQPQAASTLFSLALPQSEQSLSQELPDSPEDILKDMPPRKLFKSQSKPIGKTGSQTKCFLHKE